MSPNLNLMTLINTNLLHNDLNISLEKMLQGDYLLQNFAIFTHLKKVDDPVKFVMDMIDLFYNEMDENKEIIKPIRNYQDIIDNQNKGLMSAMLTLEEGAVVNNDLAYLRNYYRLGVRMITLTWNFENGIGFPNFSSDGYGEYDDQNGLTDFGIQYIQECERLGIIIDVSHLNDAGFYDVLKYTKAPFVASHSNARAVCRHARNMSDDMIQQLAKRGGVMGINFAADFLAENADMSTIDNMVKHIKYIKNIGGIDCIGLGTDFDGIPQNLELKDASYMPMLEKALRKENFTAEEIEKIFYKNVLILYQQVLK
ncbi:MAG: dipeptidase [Erysipelotrichaceae bacterium]|nr:dipeptidase [Erysipelotrichaceae bacterium]